MISTLALLLALSSPRMVTFALPSGETMTVTRSGSAKPGAKTWSCSGPRVLEGGGTLAVSGSGMSFSPSDGVGSGGVTWSGIKNSFVEGEKVHISVSANKMEGRFTAIGCANGEQTFAKDLKDPGGQRNADFEFTFQPIEGRADVTLVCDFHTTSSTWQNAQRGSISWTLTPGTVKQEDPPITTVQLSLADAQAVHASFLMRGSPVKELSKIDEYVVSVANPKGVAADGTSLLVVRAATDKAGSATLSLSGAGGALYPLEGEVPVKSPGSKSLSLKTRTDSAGKFWYLALYRPPSYFPPPKNGETKKTVPIYFSLSSDAGGKDKIELNLVHPPIVLVHGTYDNPLFCYQTHSAEDDSPFTMTEWFERLGFQVFSIDWEEWNGMKDPSDFQTNKTRIYDGKNGIRDALETLRRAGIIVSQADVICHSQGGVIARTYCRGYPFEVSMPPTSKHYTDPDHCKVGEVDCWYHRADNYYIGDIHRLITISTTHRGSAVCNLFETLKAFPDQTLAENFIKLLIDSFLAVVDKTASGIYSGGFKNQVPDSLELQLIGPTPVPAHAIACVCTDEDMKTVRPDSVAVAYKANIPGQGTYWNNMWKIWIGTADVVRDWAFEKLTEKAEAKGDKNARQRLAEYRACVAALPTNSTLLNLIGQQLPESDMSRKLDALFYSIRKIVFEGDRNDCTVAMTSSFGGLKPPFTFLAEHALHGWAPRYKNVQRDVLQAVECDGNIIDPDGFPGYTGIKSKSSTFSTVVRPDDLGTLPNDTGTGTGTGTGSDIQGANTGKTKPPVNVQYLKLADLTVDTAGIDMTKWTIDKEAGTLIMVQPWATVKYKIIAPKAITKEGVELIFEIEATPVPGQRVSVGMVFRGDEVKRGPGDRDLNVYVESTPTAAVTKKGRLVFNVSVPDYKSSNTIWVTTTDGPTFIYKYAMTTGDPNGTPSGGTPPGRTTPETGDTVIGTWTWAFASSGEPKESGSVTFKADGTMAWTGGSAGTWKRIGRSILLKWTGKTEDTMALSEDGKTLEGVNSDGWKVRGTRQGQGAPQSEPSAGGNWSGSWDTNRSLGAQPIILTQSGRSVTGLFNNGQSSFTGTVEGRVLTFTYAKGLLGESGRGEITISEDGKSLKGKFVMDNDPDKTPIFFEAAKVGQREVVGPPLTVR